MWEIDESMKWYDFERVSNHELHNFLCHGFQRVMQGVQRLMRNDFRMICFPADKF